MSTKIIRLMKELELNDELIISTMNKVSMMSTEVEETSRINKFQLGGNGDGNC